MKKLIPILILLFISISTYGTYVGNLVERASGGGGGAVNSVFGRTGTVVQQAGDYKASEITNTPAGNISATDLQAAINELDSEKTSATLTDGNIWVGNALNVATPLLISGDATMSNTGTLTISADKITSAKILDDEIVDADINATAAIDGDKLENTPSGNIAATTVQDAINELDSEKSSNVLTDGNILVGNALNVATDVSMSGDITIDNTGATSIGTGKVTSDDILDDEIVDADVNATAAIAPTKIANTPTGTIASTNLEDTVNELVKYIGVNASTGWISGADCTFSNVPNPREVYIAPGSIMIVDRTDSANPIPRIVSWDTTLTFQDDGIGPIDRVILAKDDNNDGIVELSQSNQSGVVDSETKRTSVAICKYFKFSESGDIEGTVKQLTTSFDASSTAHDIVFALGSPWNIAKNNSNIITIGADQEINKTEGSSFRFNSNCGNNINSCSITNDPEVIDGKIALVDISLQGQTLTTIAPTTGFTTVRGLTPYNINYDFAQFYDNNGIWTVIPTDKWVNIQINYFPVSNLFVLIAGQEIFDSQDEALAGIKESTEHPDVGGSEILAHITIQQGTTDWSTYTITNYSKFGGSGGGVGGATVWNKVGTDLVPTEDGNDVLLANDELLKMQDADTNIISIGVPTDITSDYSLTLPIDDGEENEVLKTNGSGALNFAFVDAAETTATPTGILESTDVQASLQEIVKLMSYSLSTGWISGAECTFDADNVYIASGTVLIVDRADTANPVPRIVSWDTPLTFADDDLDPLDRTLIISDVNQDGVPELSDLAESSLVSSAVKRSQVPICKYYKDTALGPITGTIKQSAIAYDTNSSLHDLVLALNDGDPWSVSGNEISSSATNELEKTFGKSYRHHTNYENDANSPSITSDAAVVNGQIGGADITFLGQSTPDTIVPNFINFAGTVGNPIVNNFAENYSDNGVWTSIPNNSWVNLRVRFFPISNAFFLIAGQRIYPTKADALAEVYNESYDENPALGGSEVLCHITIEEGETNWQNATFTQIKTFGASSGGGGGTSPISTVFGRTGDIVATSGDYSASLITNTAAGNIVATNVQNAINELDTEKVIKSGDTMTGDLVLDTLLKLKDSDGTDNYISVKAPTNMTADWTLTLPDDAGIDTQFLQTDGNGNTAWATVGSDRVAKAGDTMTGDLVLQTQLELGDDDNSNFVNIKSHATVPINYTLTLPVDDGTANYLLKTDGIGNLSWQNPATLGPIESVFGRTGKVVSTTSDYDAIQIDNTAAGNIVATNVQDAINELDTEKVIKSGDTMTGDLVLDTLLKLKDSDGTDNYISVKAPTNMTADYTLTLPDNDGDANQVLTTDGNGGLSWTTAAVGGSGYFFGSVKWDPTENCWWPATQTSMGNWPADADCDDNARTVKGYATSATSGAVGNADGTIPQIKFASLPVGVYHIYLNGYIRSEGGANCVLRFSANTGEASSPVLVNQPAQNGINGVIYIDTARTNSVITLQVLRAGGTECRIQTDITGPFRFNEISVWYYQSYTP